MLQKFLKICSFKCFFQTSVGVLSILLKYLLRCCNEAPKIFEASKVLSKDPSFSLSLDHFQMPENLWALNISGQRLKRFFCENLTLFRIKIIWKNLKYVLFSKLWTSISPPKKFKVLLLGEFIEVAVCMTIFKDENFHFPSKKEFAIF